MSTNFTALGCCALGDLGERELHGDAGLFRELEGAEQPGVVGEEAEDAGDHRPVLGHDAEGAGERPALVELDADLRDALAEQAAGQVRRAGTARPCESWSRAA